MDHAPLYRSEQSIGWGVIGASRIARQRMVDAIRNQPPLREDKGIASSWVMGIYSRSSARARLFADETKLAYAFDSVEALLGRPEVSCIYISTYPRFQAELALAAIDAGKHVLCEMPLALSFERAQQVQQRAHRQGVLLAVNCTLRAHPALAMVSALVHDYAIGNILGARISNTEPLPMDRQSWRLEPEGGGVILDRTIHTIDLVRWLLADEVNVVSGLAGKALLGEEQAKPVEEEVLAALQMRRSGISIQIHDAFTLLHQHSTLEIYGTGGTLIAYRWWEEWRNSEVILVRNDDVHHLPVEKVNPYQQIVATFNDAVRRRIYQPRRGSVLAGSDDALANLRTALALGAALDSGQTISIG